MKATFLPSILLNILQIVNVSGQGTGNHITMSIENCIQTSSNTMEFDLYAKSDGVANSDLRASAFQYGINFNSGILNGGTVTVSYVNGTTDLIYTFPTFNFPASPSPNHVRIVQNPMYLNNLGGQGQVTTSGTSVKLCSGELFVCKTCTRGKYSVGIPFWNGNPISINGVTYTIDSVINDSNMVLKTSAGNQTCVPYSIGIMSVNQSFRVGKFRLTNSINWAVGSSPNFTLQDTVEVCKTTTAGLMFPGDSYFFYCPDAFYISGSGDGKRSVTSTCSIILSSGSFSSRLPLTIYPTYVTRGTTIKLSSDKNINAGQIIIFNAMGENVFADSFSGKSKSIDINMSSGVYFLKVMDGEREWVEKVVVE